MESQPWADGVQRSRAWSRDGLRHQIHATDFPEGDRRSKVRSINGAKLHHHSVFAAGAQESRLVRLVLSSVSRMTNRQQLLPWIITLICGFAVVFNCFQHFTWTEFWQRISSTEFNSHQTKDPRISKLGHLIFINLKVCTSKLSFTAFCFTSHWCLLLLWLLYSCNSETEIHRLSVEMYFNKYVFS